MDNGILKICVAGDGRLNIHPSKIDAMFQYVYREASGVYWNQELQCFQSSAPNNWDEWDHKQWYKQIVTVVKSGLGERLRVIDETVFEGNSEVFEKEIRFADEEVQQSSDDYHRYGNGNPEVRNP